MKRAAVIVSVLIVLGVLGGLALPLANLIAGLPKNNTLLGVKTADPVAAKALGILGTKCVNCHTAEYVLPFYAKLPVAKQIIEADIRLGTDYLNLQESLADGAKPAPEVLLAKSEHAIERGSMPPMRYLALHWNGALSGADRQDLLNWVKETRKRHHSTPGVPPKLAEHVLQPLPKQHQEDAAKAEMGDKLFHDKRLSKDNTISCASCHALDKGGTDHEQFSDGVEKKTGDINSPTVFNSGLQFIQFWDGRAADLVEQADGPVNNPIEMASNWPEVIGKLQQDAELTQAFNALYPAGYSKETITSAIAAFEHTLITPNCRFDKYLEGDQSALTPEEHAGYKSFLANSCATCHAGKLMGGQSFEKIGRKGDYFASRRTPASKPDFGRFNVTQKESDRFRLKVPTLRNIALTHPYLHDGTCKTLAEAVDVMSEFMVGKKMSVSETGSIVKFLETLTGEYQGKLLQ